MKHLLRSLIVACTMVIAPVAYAQEVQPPVQLSPEVKQGIELLAKGFGLEPQ